jgi:hypothetical protein
MLGSNAGLLRLLHWQLEALTSKHWATRDLVHVIQSFPGSFDLLARDWPTGHKLVCIDCPGKMYRNHNWTNLL